MRRVISILVENDSGVLSRISGLFSARGYNIESLSVAPTHDLEVSRLTIVTTGSDKVIEQIMKQLHKLIDVIKIQDLTESRYIERELILIKVKAVGSDCRLEIKHLADIFKANIIDVTPTIFTLELSETPDKITQLLEAMCELEIIEVVRSGITGIASGERTLKI